MAGEDGSVREGRTAGAAARQLECAVKTIEGNLRTRERRQIPSLADPTRKGKLSLVKDHTVKGKNEKWRKLQCEQIIITVNHSEMHIYDRSAITPANFRRGRGEKWLLSKMLKSVETCGRQDIKYVNYRIHVRDQVRTCDGMPRMPAERPYTARARTCPPDARAGAGPHQPRPSARPGSRFVPPPTNSPKTLFAAANACIMAVREKYSEKLIS